MVFCCGKKKQTQTLQNIQRQDLITFNLYNYKTTAKVVDVHDGDSIEVIFDFEGQFLKVKVRMYGYDSINIRRPKNEENRVEMKEKAIKIRDELRKQILDKVVNIQFKKWDKYGRIKAIIHMDELNINEWMIENNNGVIIEEN